MTESAQYISKDELNAAIRQAREEFLAKRRARRQAARQSTTAGTSTLQCPACGHRKVNRSKKRFADRSIHIRVECAKCHTFIKWGNQFNEWKQKTRIRGRGRPKKQ